MEESRSNAQLSQGPRRVGELGYMWGRSPINVGDEDGVTNGTAADPVDKDSCSDTPPRLTGNPGWTPFPTRVPVNDPQSPIFLLYLRIGAQY
jgi:hypothetical protein